MTLLALLVLAAGSAAAQPPDAADAQAPAHISLVEGSAILEREGERDESPRNMPLLAGDRVRTRAGRVEILFADGSTLHLDQHSAVDLQSDDLLRLLEGRIRLSIPGPAREVAYRIDGPHGWTQIFEPGEYRVALVNGPRGSELEVAVLRGRAELANEAGRTPLRAGERAFARADAAPSYAYVVNSASWDAFDRWSEARRDERRAASAHYLPSEVRPYAASFDRYGYWRDEPTYGRVWYPRVEPDWRPYYRGRWVLLRPYGWTWVAHDPWGWPTHHYGRWGYSTAGWFWIPGRTWGAAWVSWAYAPGYVSWCPLGWNNRPVVQINIINVRRGYDPWRAWTVVPHRHFGVGYVHRHVVQAVHLDDRVRSSFTYRERAPEITGYAVPRSSAPIRVAGARDQRGGAPIYTNLPADRARTTGDGQRIQVDPRGASGARPDPRAVERGVRPSDAEQAPRAVARDRAVPDRPAVRSERPGISAERPGAAEPLDRRARPRTEGPQYGQRTPPRTTDTPQYAVPRAEPRPADVPNGAARRPPVQEEMQPPQWGSGEGRRAVPRGAASPQIERAGPSHDPLPSRRPAEIQQRPQPAAGYEPREYRAVPRGDGAPAPEPRRAPGMERAAPRGAEPGPVRPSSGSYERRSPGGVEAPRPEGPPAAGAPPSGARPRPSGSGGAGPTARPRGGGGQR
ncbi:MAG TPA: DUF6600 domain-containing protein [Vicinamibacterales bacterium]|nr:DUF6600 domain-containing protein [Vicinamibacterales bacterium]